MRHSIGVFLQFICLVCLPVLIIYELNFRMHLIVIPIALVIAIVVFMLGQKLRNS